MPGILQGSIQTPPHPGRMSRLPSRNLSLSALAFEALGVYPQTAPLWCGMVHPLFPMVCELSKSNMMSDLPWLPLGPGALGLA